MRILTLIILFIYPCLALSLAPIEFKTTHPEVKNFQLAEVCKSFNLKHILYATAIGTSNVDCMGKIINVTDFCQKKFPDNKRLLRGFINYEKMATCHFADSSMLTLQCSKFKEYCSNAARGCRSLQSIYAVSLNIVHSGISDQGSGTVLKCYFARLDYEEELDLILE